MAGAVGKVINLGSGMSKKQDKLTGTAGQVVGFNAQGQAVAQTPAQVGMVPTTRKVNGKPLSADISLTASDVGAMTQTQADRRYLKLSGGDMTGMVDMQNHVLTGLPSPTAPSDAVNYQTLANLIISMADAPIVTVSGKDVHFVTANDEEFTASIFSFGCFSNNDISLNVSCRISLASIREVTKISIQFPKQFKFPKGDWSDYSQPGLRVVHSDGDIYFSPKSTIPLVFEVSNFDGGSLSTLGLSIAGNVRVGMIG